MARYSRGVESIGSVQGLGRTKMSNRFKLTRDFVGYIITDTIKNRIVCRIELEWFRKNVLSNISQDKEAKMVAEFITADMNENYSDSGTWIDAAMRSL